MNELTVTEYKDIRVLTTQQLAEAYGTDRKTISYNFNHNKDRYVEGKHYIQLEGAEKSDFINRLENHDSLKNAKILYLWTEKGAFLHAKSLNTDIAWEVYDRLVDSYFKKRAVAIPQGKELLALAVIEAQRTIEQKDKQIAEMKPKADFFDAVADSKTAVSMNDVAKVLGIRGMGRNNLFQFLRDREILDKWNKPYQKYVDLGWFRVIEQKYMQNGEQRISFKTLVYQKGVDAIRKKLSER